MGGGWWRCCRRADDVRERRIEELAEKMTGLDLETVLGWFPLDEGDFFDRLAALFDVRPYRSELCHLYEALRRHPPRSPASPLPCPAELDELRMRLGVPRIQTRRVHHPDPDYVTTTPPFSVEPQLAWLQREEARIARSADEL